MLLGLETFFVFHGADAPSVLWPVNDGTFRLVGESYVHDIMDGKALTNSDYMKRDFTLRRHGPESVRSDGYSCRTKMPVSKATSQTLFCS